MELVIKITDEQKKTIDELVVSGKCYEMLTPVVIDDVMKEIKNGTPLPKGHGRWIPVSERLPEKMGEYLCEYDFDGMCKHEILTYVPNDADTILEKNHWHNLGSAFNLITDWSAGLVAWMPLPTPYKAESEK